MPQPFSFVPSTTHTSRARKPPVMGKIGLDAQRAMVAVSCGLTNRRRLHGDSQIDVMHTHSSRHTNMLKLRTAMRTLTNRRRTCPVSDMPSSFWSPLPLCSLCFSLGADQREGQDTPEPQPSAWLASPPTLDTCRMTMMTG